MRPTRTNIYLIGDKQYAIIDRALYRLTPLDDDGIAEVFNGGDALPIVPNAIHNSL